MTPPKKYTHKRCPDCRKVKAPDSFGYRVQLGRAYLRSVCRICMSRRTREWQTENRERFNGYQREYARFHAEERKKRVRERYKKDPESFLRRCREYYRRNRERILEQHRLRPRRKKEM